MGIDEVGILWNGTGIEICRNAPGIKFFENLAGI